VRPLRYPDGNVVRNVEVRGNTIGGTLEAGVSVGAGSGAGGSRNRIEDLQIAHNLIRSSGARRGIWLLLGRGEPYKHRYATANRISGVTIDGNRVAMSRAKPLPFVDTRGGIVLESGSFFGRGGVIHDVRITNNRVATDRPGIWLVGGFGPTAHDNRVTCVRLVGNRITGTRRRVLVTPNLGDAKRNRASLGGC
jgi:hypothetical protein